MKIKAIQPLTLIDFPGKLACTIFVFGCNFQCGFCYNSSLVLKEDKPDISSEEVLNFLRKRKDYLNGICFTGAEPLMNIDTDFLHKVKSLRYSIKIDTNGSFPEKIQQLIDLGLVDYVSMDIKSSREKYSELTRANPDLEKIEQSIKIVSQIPEHEFRTTILEEIHTKEEMKKIAEWLNQVVGWKPKKFVLQGFKPNLNELIDDKFKSYKETSEEYLKELKEILKDYFEWLEVRI